MNIKKLAWTIDLHLNFVDQADFEEFCRDVNKKSPDVLLIGGDIGEAPTISSYLSKLSKTLDAPIYFILGNHDFYRGSLSAVREEVSDLSRRTEGLHFLDLELCVELTPEVGLIGESSWVDGRYGDYANSEVMLNDYVLIEEFKGLSKSQRLEKLHQLGDQAASAMREKLVKAFEIYNHVICLTHVPPFKESCWHEGQISDDNYLPHFSCKAVGDVMKEVMQSKPDSYLTVLCGHTHGSGKAQILNNLEVRTGEAIYGLPKIQEIIGL